MKMYGIVGTAELYYIAPGLEHTLPAGAVLVATARPTPDAVLLAEGTWLVDIRPTLLEDIMSRKNAFRDGGFDLDGIRWDSDPSARIAYAELAQRLATDPGFVTRWKASNGQWVTMTHALFTRMYEAGAAHIASAFAWQEAEEERLANTPDADLAGFVISAP